MKEGFILIRDQKGYKNLLYQVPRTQIIYVSLPFLENIPNIEQHGWKLELCGHY